MDIKINHQKYNHCFLNLEIANLESNGTDTELTLTMSTEHGKHTIEFNGIIEIHEFIVGIGQIAETVLPIIRKSMKGEFS